MNLPNKDIDLTGLNEFEVRERRREWNRGPLTDCFPRIPATALEDVLDICIDKGYTYQLSKAKEWNARRLSSIVIAHARHRYTDYDKLLRSGMGRFDARQQVSNHQWKVLREWCPWDSSNEALERCFQNTLVRPEERDPEWDPMDLDVESDYEPDPMDLD